MSERNGMGLLWKAMMGSVDPPPGVHRHTLTLAEPDENGVWPEPGPSMTVRHDSGASIADEPPFEPAVTLRLDA